MNNIISEFLAANLIIYCTLQIKILKLYKTLLLLKLKILDFKRSLIEKRK
jgi:hypothetical protein